MKDRVLTTLLSQNIQLFRSTLPRSTARLIAAVSNAEEACYKVAIIGIIIKNICFVKSQPASLYLFKADCCFYMPHTSPSSSPDFYFSFFFHLVVKPVYFSRMCLMKPKVQQHLSASTHQQAAVNLPRSS